jgi:gliding motility associated protien GldN
MKKLVYFLAVIVLISSFTVRKAAGQQMNLIEKKEVYDKEHIPKKDPIPYPFVREADVMWEKVIWRMINLREKMNHPYYFPTKPIGDRKSLTSLLLEALEHPVPGHAVFAYKPLLNYEFEQPLNIEDIYKTLDVDSIYEPVMDSITGVTLMKLTGVDIRLSDVTRLLVKEKWFFDRKYSTLQVRIIGICPMRVFPMTITDQTTGISVPTGDINQQPLFWVYYPEVRFYLARQETFNPNNDAQPISFDDMFNQRLFSSYIYKESNVFNDRPINSYAKGMDAMFESDRVKQSIFEYEHDLWEY